MAHIILTGATGTAGAGILAYALNSPAIARISILSRRPVKLAENQPKAHVILHQDFNSYPQSLLEQVGGATACIWAQGKSSRGMNEEDYTTLTHDYPVAAAKAFAGLSHKFVFVYVSGEGADMAKADGGGVLFARVKGRAERSLLHLQQELPSLRVYNIRPGAINPDGNYLAERTTTLQDKILCWLGIMLEKTWKSMAISTSMLAKACTALAIGGGEPIPSGPAVEAGGRVLRNLVLRQIAEGVDED